MSGSYRDLKAWQKGMDLVFRIYEVTRRFPKDELYGLTSQLRRAAVSIPSNIAEGKGRSTDREFALYLSHARGSAHEVETQILIARHLGYLTKSEAEELSALSGELARILSGLIRSFKPPAAA